MRPFVWTAESTSNGTTRSTARLSSAETLITA
jgi:hypothetical protein